LQSPGLSGAIYSRTTDVENERNGYKSYHRKLVEMDLKTVAERSYAVIAAGATLAEPLDIPR
jgi:hypothetical protein